MNINSCRIEIYLLNFYTCVVIYILKGLCNIIIFYPSILSHECLFTFSRFFASYSFFIQSKYKLKNICVQGYPMPPPPQFCHWLYTPVLMYYMTHVLCTIVIYLYFINFVLLYLYSITLVILYLYSITFVLLYLSACLVAGVLVSRLFLSFHIGFSLDLYTTMIHTNNQDKNNYCLAGA